jgi:hypothetical protein
MYFTLLPDLMTGTTNHLSETIANKETTPQSEQMEGNAILGCLLLLSHTFFVVMTVWSLLQTLTTDPGYLSDEFHVSLNYATRPYFSAILGSLRMRSSG